VAKSGELQRALGQVNRGFEGLEASERNQAARRGQPSGRNYVDRQRIAALQGEFGQQANREEERRRYDMNALNAALMARQGQDTNRQLRARYGQTDQRTGTNFGQSFDPGAAAMNALNFQNAGLAPTASPLTGQAAPWAQGLSTLGNAGTQALMAGLIPNPFGGGGGPMQLPAQRQLPLGDYVPGLTPPQ
jgi:hypothetical protein